MWPKDDRRKRHTVMLRPSRHLRGSLSLAGGSKVLEKSSVQAPRPAVRVFDEEAKDVTPRPLLDPGSTQTTVSWSRLNESSAEQTAASGSSTLPIFRSLFGSSRISSQSTVESVNEDMEETFSKWDVPISFPDERKPKETVTTEVTEDLLKQIVQVVLTETDSCSLLDIPTSRVSVDADDAETILDRNSWYAEACRKQTDNQCLDQSIQTFNGLTKNKHVQSNSRAVMDAATTGFILDMLDSPEQEDTLSGVETLETKKTDSPEAVLDSGSAERSSSLVSSVTTVTACSSLKGADVFGSSFSPQPDLQLLVMSERFQHSVFVMERSILRNSFQPLLTTCRQLPLLPDPDELFKQEAEEHSEEDTETSLSPALKALWVFSSELSSGCSVSSMAWNKKNPELLAVGYGDFDFRNQKPGLVLCWSLRNPLWPERVIHCGSAVTSLDFSVSSPGQLAVGMWDGSIAIFNLQSPHVKTHLSSSTEASNRHTGPVWQLKWNQQELRFTGETQVESLFSVGVDGRFIKWSVFRGGLDGEDLLMLKRMDKIKRKDGVKTTAESLLSALTPALCFDFHPTNSSLYLTGTWEGGIYKCSSSNNQDVLDTYKKHSSPVNCISWCPLNPDVFLSCSDDWTIQLWNQDCLVPVQGFSSPHGAVNDIKWSPKWTSVFGALTEGHLEIWDLNSSCLVPVFVQPAAPGVKMTSLLFASQTDCVVVGDTCGQVTVYQLKHLGGQGV